MWGGGLCLFVWVCLVVLVFVFFVVFGFLGFAGGPGGKGFYQRGTPPKGAPPKRGTPQRGTPQKGTPEGSVWTGSGGQTFTVWGVNFTRGGKLTMPTKTYERSPLVGPPPHEHRIRGAPPEHPHHMGRGGAFFHHYKPGVKQQVCKQAHKSNANALALTAHTIANMQVYTQNNVGIESSKPSSY